MRKLYLKPRYLHARLQISERRADAHASAIIVSTSSRKDRLEGYLDVGDIDLTKEEVEQIDQAGRKGQLDEERKELAKKVGKWVAVVALAGYAGFKTFF